MELGLVCLNGTEHPMVCEIALSCSWKAIFDSVNEGVSHPGMQHFTPHSPPLQCNSQINGQQQKLLRSCKTIAGFVTMVRYNYKVNIGPLN